MKEQDIIKAYTKIRTIDNTIPDDVLDFMKNAAIEQLRLCGVGSSTYKIAISDSFCTYDFEMELPKTTCIRDIARRLYASFGLKEEQGRLRE